MRNISTTALATLSTWMELHHILQQATLHSILNLSTFRIFSGPVFDTVWTGPFNESRPIQQTSAFDLFLAGVEERVTCTGPGCHYDPHPAKPKPLTCHVSAYHSACNHCNHSTAGQPLPLWSAVLWV